MQRNVTGERIRLEREKRGISQVDLGNNLGLTRQTIGYLESGKRRPDSKTILKLCGFFNCSSDYLLGLTDIANEYDKMFYQQAIDSLDGIEALDRLLIISALGRTISNIAMLRKVDQPLKLLVSIISTYGEVISKVLELKEKTSQTIPGYSAFIKDVNYLKWLIDEHKEYLQKAILDTIEDVDYRQQLIELFSITERGVK